MPDPIIIDFDDPALQEFLLTEKEAREAAQAKLSQQLVLQISCLLFLLQQGRDAGFSYCNWLTHNIDDGYQFSLKQSLIRRGNDSNDSKGRTRFLILDKKLATGAFGIGYQSTKGLTLDADNHIGLKYRQPNNLRFFKLVLLPPNGVTKTAFREALTREAATWQALEGSKRIKPPQSIIFCGGVGLQSKKYKAPQEALGMLGIYYEGVEIEVDFLKKSIDRKDYCYPQDKFARLEIIVSFLQALVAIHAKDFVHGDLKPGNLILNPITRQVKIIDYDHSHKVGVKLMKAIGTPEYASLVALTPPVKVHTGIDIYSAAIVMFELWHGRMLPDVRKGKLLRLTWRNAYKAAVEEKLLEDTDNPLRQIIIAAMKDDTQLSAQDLLEAVVQEQKNLIQEEFLSKMKL